MFNKNIGFIGYGNIAKAMIEGFLKKEKVNSNNIFIYDHKIKDTQQFIVQHNIIPINNIENLLTKIDILFLTVKPNVMPDILKKISKKQIKTNIIIVSVAAGITLNLLENIIGEKHKIVRAMPNIACLVNESITAISLNQLMFKQDILDIVKLFNYLGKTIIINESLMHAVVGISGSAVAYIFILIEAMSDAAVLAGMPRIQAYDIACQTVKGASQMIIETKKHPGELKDMVCSPKGTTIEAVRMLENKGFRSAIIESTYKAIKKSKKISKDYMNIK